MTVKAEEMDNGAKVKIVIKGRFDFNDHASFRESYSNCSQQAGYTLDMTDAD